MNQPRLDRDRMLLYAVLLSALISIVLYATVYSTFVAIGPLNETGVLVTRVALFVAGGTLGLSLVLALTARSASLSSASLSGAGWFLIFSGVALVFPAWGLSAAGVPSLSGFGGYAGAILLVLSGGLLRQAEIAVREKQNTPGER